MPALSVVGMEKVATTAVLIDVENIVFADRHRHQVDWTSLLVHADIADGTTVRAYGNFHLAALRSQVEPLEACGVAVVHVPGREPNGKVIHNSADIRLAVDAVSLAYKHPELKRFVILSGDGGLRHLVDALHGLRRQVVVVAVADACSILLAEAADGVTLIDRHTESVPLRPEAQVTLRGLDELSDDEHAALIEGLEMAFGSLQQKHLVQRIENMRLLPARGRADLEALVKDLCRHGLLVKITETCWHPLKRQSYPETRLVPHAGRLRSLKRRRAA